MPCPSSHHHMKPTLRIQMVPYPVPTKVRDAIPFILESEIPQCFHPPIPTLHRDVILRPKGRDAGDERTARVEVSVDVRGDVDQRGFLNMFQELPRRDHVRLKQTPILQ